MYRSTTTFAKPTCDRCADKKTGKCTFKGRRDCTQCSRAGLRCVWTRQPEVVASLDEPAKREAHNPIAYAEAAKGVLGGRDLLCPPPTKLEEMAWPQLQRPAAKTPLEEGTMLEEEEDLPSLVADTKSDTSESTAASGSGGVRAAVNWHPVWGWGIDWHFDEE